MIGISFYEKDALLQQLEHEKSATKPTQLELERLNEIMERNETIERCAQVADADSYGEGIAAEIRKLKDER